MLAPGEVSVSGLRDLWTVLSSDLGYRSLGWLFLEQGQGVSFFNGAQLLLLCFLELGRVSDLRKGEIGGISVDENPVSLGERGSGAQNCSRTTDHLINGLFPLPQPAPLGWVLTTWTISALRSFSRRRLRFSARRSFFS